ncbi:5-amp-activated protein kinase subunit beta-2 [Lichtheimia corymbifera JMRC:FSU:9682]|uniref:5-amp-activated protein kinase subunit beta-2 n=1 Tax=Lichtheimia corymbifera JMRC:FSU:9682 TaxID=1263082 RepID=A0A068SBK3_9FUNG|nr:5-amp-activated protein kinase subunit beta-2 [Lichtheimia corymbifera JMRC:FSU:9682]
MGNSNSTESNHSDRHNVNATSSTGGYPIDKKSPAPPIVTPSSHKDTDRRIPFRLSVTSYSADNDSDRPPDSATSDISASGMGGEERMWPSSLSSSPVGSSSNNPNTDTPTISNTTPATTTTATTTTTTAPTTATTTTHAPRAVPLSTGKSGWVSSTGNTSPWYGGSLSSSTSSHHRSDSVRGPYYRARAMSVNRDSEADDESSSTITQQRFNRNPSMIRDSQQKGIPTIITWAQGGQNVYVTGTFNGWKHKIKLVKSTQDFTAVLELPPGTHRLKFIVDDEWKCSNEMETATDPDGNLVNYLQVSDEYEDSLDDFGDNKTDQGSRSSTPTEEYTSQIPADLLALAANISEDEQGQKITSEWEQRQPQPPSLPPHLETVLLNSQAISEEDNSVLPEPNHVTLNHLYASSIKDNVMALSTTTRYRKKYVTTMYYRPVFPKRSQYFHWRLVLPYSALGQLGQQHVSRLKYNVCHFQFPIVTSCCVAIDLHLHLYSRSSSLFARSQQDWTSWFVLESSTYRRTSKPLRITRVYHYGCQRPCLVN